MANYLRVIGALTIARNKEFYRDRGSMMWSFVLPLCIIAAIAVAFGNEDQAVFNVGVYSTQAEMASNAPLLEEKYISTIYYTDLEKALTRVRNHQLDLLISVDNGNQYWINETSVRGQAVERLLLAESFMKLERQTVSGKQVRYLDWVIPGVLGMNIMFGALFGIGFVIVRYRKNGVLKRLQATPVTPFQFLSAQIISRATLLLTAAIIVYTGANYFVDFVMLGSYLDLFVLAALGILSMISLALIVASRTASEELANGLLNLCSFPMLLLSEVWFSLDNAPGWLKGFSQCLPLTHLIQGAREIMINGATLASLSYHVGILAGSCLIFMGIASFSFRWNQT